MKRLFISLLLVLTIAACDAATTTPSSSNPTDVPPTANVNVEPSPTREGDTGGIDVSGDPGSGFGIGSMLDGQGFAAVASGGNVALEFHGMGYFGCENGNTYAIRPTSGSLPQLSVIVPSDTSAGTYTIGDNNITVSVATADNQVYAGVIAGVLVLDEIANAVGEKVAGSFDFDVTNGSNTVNAQGEFDFTTTDATVFCG